MADESGPRRFKRIACVQLDPRMPDYCFHLIMPRYGLPVIGAILEDAGYETKVFIEHVAPPDLDWIRKADLVLLSSLTNAANRTYEFADWVKREVGVPVIMGGEHASSFAQDSLKWVDICVRREGDGIILPLIHALEEGESIAHLPGISYKVDGRVVHNESGDVPDNINVPHDLSIIHGYPKGDGWRLFLKRRQVKVICVQATRGCPFRCNFCVAPRLFGYTYRNRETEVVIDDIKRKLPWGNDFLFVDNLFAINKRRVHALLDRMIEEKIGEQAEFTAFCRVEISREPDTLEKMYRAGMRTICLGLESINDQTLDGLDKQQTLEDMKAAIRAIQVAGIAPSGSFIAGNEGDTPESLLRTVDFAIEAGLNSFYYISLWFYPGDPRCPLIPQRQIIPSFDYATGHFVTHFPELMKPSTLQRTIVAAQRKFWNLGRAARCAMQGNFRRARHLASHRYAFSLVEKHQLEYAHFLETIEYGYYDANEHLIMDRILQREPDAIVKQAAAANEVRMDSLKATRRNAPHMHTVAEAAVAG